MCASIQPLGCEPVALSAATERTLGEAQSAARDQPPFRSSAMDGYAVRAADLARGRFDIVGESAAGSPHLGAIRAGEAVRIFTGAPVPDGADMVVQREKTRCEGAALSLLMEVDARPWANIRAVALDFKAGERLIAAGTRLNARHIALAAAAGIASVSASRVPRVALLATGTEIAAPGAAAGSHQVYDSVTFGLAAMTERWGGNAVRRGASPDDDAAISAALMEVLNDADLIVIVGGASVGDYDVVKRALTSRGLEILVPQVAVRPGKPTWFGTIGSKPVLGLPGNPAAAFVCAYLFLRPLLNTLLKRNAPPDSVHAVLDGVLRECGASESYLRATVSVGADARLVARPFDNQDTSLVSVFAASNALIRRVPGSRPAAHGAIVEAVLFDDFCDERSIAAPSHSASGVLIG
jgi:molybdopterin molybdotransferase